MGDSSDTQGTQGSRNLRSADCDSLITRIVHNGAVCVCRSLHEFVTQPGHSVIVSVKRAWGQTKMASVEFWIP